MKECIHNKFILDGEIVDCSYFKPDMINKGTSVYEVIRLINNCLLFAEDHFHRMECSARLGKLDLWYSSGEIALMVNRLPALNASTEGNIKIVFNYLDEKRNHFLAYFVEPYYPRPDDYIKGVKVITYPFIRKDPNKKIWLPEFRARVNDILIRKKIYEVLLVDKNNHITEGSRANFFAIKKRMVFTPPAESVLLGVTRKYVIYISKKIKIPVTEKEISEDALKEFDAVFLTSTSANVLPVSQINNLVFDVGNPTLRTLMKEFENLIKGEIEPQDITG